MNRSRRSSLSLALPLVGALTACAPIGLVYNGVSAPPPGNALNQQGGERVFARTGESCAQGVLGLVAWGDASQSAAARNGGLTKIHGADARRFSVLGFVYRRYCTVVSGE